MGSHDSFNLQESSTPLQGQFKSCPDFLLCCLSPISTRPSEAAVNLFREVMPCCSPDMAPFNVPPYRHVYLGPLRDPPFREMPKNMWFKAYIPVGPSLGPNRLGQTSQEGSRRGNYEEPTGSVEGPIWPESLVPKVGEHGPVFAIGTPL